MAHVKASATTKGNRDSRSKRLGVKLYGGEDAKVGNIIIRQKGSKVHPGAGTKMGKDFSIYSMKSGKVKFIKKLSRQYVTVES